MFCVIYHRPITGAYVQATGQRNGLRLPGVSNAPSVIETAALSLSGLCFHLLYRFSGSFSAAPEYRSGTLLHVRRQWVGGVWIR